MIIDTLRNAWKIEDIRKKINFTILMLFIYRIGTFVPIPGINSDYIRQLVADGGLLSFFDIITGGAFANFTIFALGITPHINASIIMQLLTVAIPKLEQLAKEGEEGRKKIAQYTRYFTIILAFVQAFGITYGLAQGAIRILVSQLFCCNLDIDCWNCILMWLVEQITDKVLGTEFL